jgi:hypothetical protein
VNDTPVIGRFGWITLATFGTVVATVMAYAFTVAMDAPSKRLEDLRGEVYREIDIIKTSHARIEARDDIIERRLDDLKELAGQLEAQIKNNTQARLRGGRFTSDDGDRLEKMLTLLERRMERLEDRVYAPFLRPHILETPDGTDG